MLHPRSRITLCSKVKKNVPLRHQFSQELLLCETDACIGTFVNTIILTTVSQGSIAICPPYPHNLPLLPCSFSFIPHASFNTTIVTIFLYLAWLSNGLIIVFKYVVMLPFFKTVENQEGCSQSEYRRNRKSKQGKPKRGFEKSYIGREKIK